MRKHRASIEYMEGVKEFLRFAIWNSRTNGLIKCPFKQCGMCKTLRPGVVYDHLISEAGILPGYTAWVMHKKNIMSGTGQATDALFNREPIQKSSIMAPYWEPLAST